MGALAFSGRLVYNILQKWQEESDMTPEEITRLATEYRRDLHQIPELDARLPETCAYVKRALSDLHCTVVKPAPSAICAFFDFGRPDTVAWRADMDALPVEEKTDLPW